MNKKPEPLVKNSIQLQIEELILSNLKNEAWPQTAEDVYRYRDQHFLSGHYDYLFERFIKEKGLK